MFFSKKDREKYETEIATLRHQIADLKQIVVTQELIKLRNENAALKEKETQISKIKFRLKSVAYSDESDAIIVKYEVPNICVRFDDKGKIQKQDMFYAINVLKLISFDDMNKIQKVINETERRKEKNA